MQSLNIKSRQIILVFALVNYIYLQIVVASETPTDDSSQAIIHHVDLLTIENAIGRALEFTPRLQSAASRMDAAQGAQLQASLLPNPELAFEAENFSGNDDFGSTNSAEYTLSLNQKIELGGKRDARKQVAQASYAVAQEGLSIERLNIIKDVHSAYVNVLANTQSVKLAIEQEQLAKDILANVSKRVQSAAESAIQQSKAEVTVANSLILREQTNQQLQIARHNLAKLWGESSFDDSLNHQYLFQLDEPMTYEVYLERLDELPDVQQFIHQKSQMDSLFDLANTEKIVDPVVSIGVRRFEEGSDNAFLVGVSVPLQIFNKNQGNIAQAQAESLQAQSDAQQFELNLKQALFENWQTWKTAFMEAAHMKTKLIPAAEQSFHLAQSAYNRGRFTYLEVLDAQRTLIEAQNQYLSTLRNYHTARINVKRLTNGFGEQG
ncbi:MAG: TolC family protein [Gammaproteobacteria bacterium]|nr:TolC family protein [Gammaproteobacteria bacterium]